MTYRIYEGDGLTHFIEKSRSLARKVDAGEEIEPEVVTYLSLEEANERFHDSEPDSAEYHALGNAILDWMLGSKYNRSKPCPHTHLS